MVQLGNGQLWGVTMQNGAESHQVFASHPVLLVQADLASRERLYDLLTHHGFPVISVHSGAHALKLLKHERPGLMVVDTQLPDMTGWTLLEQLRAFNETLPVILLARDEQMPASPDTTEDTTVVLLPHTVSDVTLIHEVGRQLTAPLSAPRERWAGTIMVVDDEPKLRHIVQEFLELHGFTVLAAASGEEALERVRHDTPQVVLLDIKMSGMDGLVTLKKLKAFQPATTVIMITGLEEEQLMEQAFALGAADYITKPFNFEYLEATLLSRILLGRQP